MRYNNQNLLVCMIYVHVLFYNLHIWLYNYIQLIFSLWTDPWRKSGNLSITKCWRMIGPYLHIFTALTITRRAPIWIGVVLQGSSKQNRDLFHKSFTLRCCTQNIILLLTRQLDTKSAYPALGCKGADARFRWPGIVCNALPVCFFLLFSVVCVAGFEFYLYILVYFSIGSKVIGSSFPVALLAFLELFRFLCRLENTRNISLLGCSVQRRKWIAVFCMCCC